MRYLIAIFLAAADFLLAATSAATEFLSPPLKITEAELLTGAEDRGLDMQWSLKNQGYTEIG